MNEPIRIGLSGKGRLGAAIADHLGERVSWHVTREAPPHADIDVIIEAAKGESVEPRLQWALEHRIPLVIGSTGWQVSDLAARVDDRIGVVTAPNFSLGVVLARRLAIVLARFASRDTALDPYVIEHHQARKADAPSGTAALLADAMVEANEHKRSWRIGGPIEPDVLSVGVVRAGSTYSEHRIGIDAPAEVLELRHTARSAQAFADGALTAAHWIRSRKGVFTMEDVAASVLDPLFTGMSGAAS